MVKEASRKERQALSDALTGLPNRTLFNELLEKALAECPRNKRVGVLLMDLDRFKEINDSLGHFNGDRVIERVGERLKIIVREGDTVARLGGDEFAMLLPNIADADAATAAASRVHKTLEEPFTAGGLALRVEASVGIALYPDHGDKSGKLMRAADVAMYASKKGHLGHAIYSPEQQHYSPARLGLVAQLDRAMAQGELVLHYQPKARFDNGVVEGAEALVRWQHPERGLLLPAEFIPVTEHTSMIRPVTIHLLEMALEQGMVWRRNGIELRLAVNLSPQILLDLELPKEIQKMLSRVGAPADSLELEVTESAIIYDPRRAQIVLEGLSEMGLRIAIDDFGTGYSSLTSLKNLPVSTIKIDKSFVMAMDEDNSDAAIVKSTIQLGRNLGLEVVAEGVETPNAWTRLADMGCDLAQGYYLSRALDGSRFMGWLGAYEQKFAAGPPPLPVPDPLAEIRPGRPPLRIAGPSKSFVGVRGGRGRQEPGCGAAKVSGDAPPDHSRGLPHLRSQPAGDQADDRGRPARSRPARGPVADRPARPARRRGPSGGSRTRSPRDPRGARVRSGGSAAAPPGEGISEPDTERVLALEAELRELRSQLDSARIRISELEASGFGRALRGSGERGALAPLFRPTTDA